MNYYFVNTNEKYDPGATDYNKMVLFCVDEEKKYVC